MGQFNRFYRQAFYYDIVFDRDVSRDVDFLIAVYQQYTGRDPTSALELGCGPAYHARELARRGRQVVGLDFSEEMLHFAEQKARAEGLQLSWVRADMRDFRLDEPVDLAISIFDANDALLTNADQIQLLRNVAENLTPHGIFVIDMSPPQEVGIQHYPLYEYQGQRDSVSVELLYGVNRPQVDPVTSVALVDVELRVNEAGRERVFRDSAFERMLTPQEIALIAELSQSLQLVRWYGDFDLNQPLDTSPNVTHAIAVLQKV